MRKYKQPIDQEPSKQMIRNIQSLSLPKAPIVDTACGYGRNGAYFVDKGYSVTFIDCDDTALAFIQKGKGVSIHGDIDTRLVTTLQMDLNRESWPFEKNTLGGVICVHYYNRHLIPYILESICAGGFLYIETIDAKGYNYLELPEYKYLHSMVRKRFDILYYSEKLVKPYELNVATLKMLAVKCSD